eukprot:509982_1
MEFEKLRTQLPSHCIHASIHSNHLQHSQRVRSWTVHVSCYHCGRAEKHKSQYILYKLQDTLFVHLNVLNFVTRTRNSNRFDIAKDINLRPYTHSEIRTFGPDEYFNYELVGVIVHDGTRDQGMNYSVIKNRDVFKGTLLVHGYIALHGLRDLMGIEVIESICQYYAYFEWIYVFDKVIRGFDMKHFETATFRN